MEQALKDQPAKARQAAVPKHMQAGTVYYLRVDNRVKIGWASDLGKRLKAYPPGHELLAYEPGTRADEDALHQRCTPWRCDGREWYTPGPGIDRVIAEARERNRLRERMEQAARPRTNRPGWAGPPQVTFSN